jgi:hypothetical protein
MLPRLGLRDKSCVARPLGWGSKYLEAGFGALSFEQMARPERFERPPPRFVVQKYPFAAFLKCTLHYGDNSSNPFFRPFSYIFALSRVQTSELPAPPKPFENRFSLLGLHHG